uniref:Hypothetical secreted peptide n=1 Tax=Glossina morsitans morsitans TaxID=37546 RepID=D3TSS5_GLOMM
MIRKLIVVVYWSGSQAFSYLRWFRGSFAIWCYTGCGCAFALVMHMLFSCIFFFLFIYT